MCLDAAAARKLPARNSEQQVTVLRRVLKLTVKAAEAMSKGAVNFLGGNARSIPVHALPNGAIMPACATRASLSSPAAAPRTPDKKVRCEHATHACCHFPATEISNQQPPACHKMQTELEPKGWFTVHATSSW